MTSPAFRPCLAFLLALLAFSPARAAGEARLGELPPPAARQRFEGRAGAPLAWQRAADGFEARGATSASGGALERAELERRLALLVEATRELLGAEAGELLPARRLTLAGLELVELEQRIGGLPVENARVELRLRADGAPALLRARGLARGGLEKPLLVRPVEARQLARLSCPDDPSTLWAGPARALARRADDGRARAAWLVEVFDPARPEASRRVLLDGADGTLLELRAGVLHALDGKVEGRGIASGPQTASAPSALPLSGLYVAGIDRATAFAQVTDDGCEDDEVVISADGSRLAWTKSCGGSRDLWSASSDGSGATVLASHAADDHSPVISADGSRIVFVSDRDGDLELYAIGSDGTGLVQLTHNAARDHSPSLSGDGTRVVYLSDLDGDDELFTLLVDAPNPTQLTFDTTPDEAPRISQDGSRIVWVSRAEADAEIFTMDPSGGSRVQVTVNDVEDVEPDISPDGSRVVFASQATPRAHAPGDPSLLVAPALRARLWPRQHDLFEAAADASSLRRLSYTEHDERRPSYAADGECIAYQSGEGDSAEIELLQLESGELLRLTEDLFADGAPRVAASCGTGAWISRRGDGEVFVWDLALPGASARATTAEDGSYSLTLPDGLTPSVSARLRGAWARVVDLDPRWADVQGSLSSATPASGADLLLHASGAAEGPTAQVTAYAHAARAHDALAAIMSRAPLSLAGPLPIDRALELRTGFPSPVPNAFYSIGQGLATFFIGAGASRPNTAYDTLVLHEAGHFYDDLLGGLSTGSSCEAAGALSEAWGDVVASFVSGSPVIGAHFFGPDAAIRDYASFPWSSPSDPIAGRPVGAKGRQQDCLDCLTVAGKPEIHEHGQAFAGFAWDLRALLGTTTAEDLLVGTFLSNPPDMQAAVHEVFALASSAAFGGTGDPATSPHYAAICKAAARHGFDCPPRPDFGSRGCGLFLCGPVHPAVHKVTGTERLGSLVLTEGGCEPVPSPEDDGVSIPSPVWAGGLGITLTFSLAVDPALRFSGRYGAPLPETQLPERRVYLNAWLFIDDTEGDWIVHKLLGTGSGSGVEGPDTIEPGSGTIAFNPDTWPGSTFSFAATITPPSFTENRFTILRVRLDHGEDAGRIDGCLTDPAHSGPCGPSRFGEVEDYQLILVPPL